MTQINNLSNQQPVNFEADIYWINIALENIIFWWHWVAVIKK